MSKPTIKLECYNGPNGQHYNYEFPNNEINGEFGEASTMKIQFDINRNPGPGTVFVDENNDGIAIATIPKGYTLIDADYEFDPSGTDTNHGGGTGKKNEILKSIKVKFKRLSIHQYHFSVKLIKDIGEKHGNVTLVFFVKYRKAD